MEARSYLQWGIALSVLGILASVLAGAFNDTDLERPLRLVSGLTTLVGLLLLILAVYALAAPASMPVMVSVGALLFAGGRLVSILLQNLLPVSAFADPAIGLLFSLLGVVSGIGTIVLVYGVYQVVRARLESGPAPRPAAAPAPGPAAPKAAPAPVGAAPPRRSSFRPPQAPLPPPPKAPAARADAPPK